ncbi:MAG: hypothetical protein JRI89_16805, partial [Deltaproteobacteria bacterium]|nr:hypothetical protein [Deltaproteobacteria bacterium]
MNYRHLIQLIYDCHNLSGSRKDSLARKLATAVDRSNYRSWKNLLLPSLAVKEEFFKAHAPASKVKILGDLCEAMRRLKRTGLASELYSILDEMYAPPCQAISGGEAAAFLRMRFRQSEHREVRAGLAAVIMELPAEQHHIEEVAAAIHGDYLLAIRAMERLCAFGEPGLQALNLLLEEISPGPAITFTLLRIIGKATCRASLKRRLTARLLLGSSRQDSDCR